MENSHNFKKGATILRLFTNNEFNNTQFASELRAEAFKILSSKEIVQLANFLEKNDIDFESLRWSEYDKKFHKIRNNLRHIFKSLSFTTNAKMGNACILEAVQFLQNHLSNNCRKIKNPRINFIPKYLHKYLYKNFDGKNILDEERYEMLLYRKLRKKTGSSDIFICNSSQYCSLENDLTDKKEFENNMDEICNNIGTAFLTEDLKQRTTAQLVEIEQLFKEVDDNIINCHNHHLKFKDEKNKNSKWHLSYAGIENKDINNSIFNKIPRVDLINLVFFINKETKFLSAFTHILNRNLRSALDNVDLLAAIIAYATNIGIGKMASCSNLSYSQLRKIKDNYLREETLKLANEIIINEINKLPIQKIYDIDGKIYSSIDGKKYDSGKNVFNARYSRKYFFEKGISVLTLITNFLPLVLKITSPNEYEGHFGLEILLMNESDLQPQINSTDMHGINELNHALYDFAGYEFQPRYTNKLQICIL